MPIAVGIDMVETDEIRESLRSHGERYLNRTFTDVERRDCGLDPKRLAARFAAKEATMKAMRLLPDEALPWRSIGVVHDANGRPGIRLTDVAAALADRRGVRRLDLTITYRRSLAVAVVLAELDDDGPPDAESTNGAHVR